ncbi:hypothetical protein P8452_60121 [Trifolium repens]|nr:hypothetical protein P8452_60121 [Trifolium repens]
MSNVSDSDKTSNASEKTLVFLLSSSSSPSQPSSLSKAITPISTSGSAATFSGRQRQGGSLGRGVSPSPMLSPLSKSFGLPGDCSHENGTLVFCTVSSESDKLDETGRSE